MPKEHEKPPIGTVEEDFANEEERWSSVTVGAKGIPLEELPEVSREDDL